MGKKRSKATKWKNIAITLVVLMVLVIGAGFMFSVGDDVKLPGSGDDVKVNVDLLNSQEITFSAVEKYNPATPLTGVTCTYYENGVKSTDTDCTFTVKRDVEYEMIVEKAGYVSIVKEFTGLGTPMTGEQFKMADFMDMSSAITVYNKDGSTNGVSSTYAIGDSENKNIEFEISGISKDVFPGGIITFEVNDSAVEDLDFTLGTKVTTPAQYTSSAVGTKDYSFQIEEVDSTVLKTGLLSVTAKDGVNPGVESITYTLYDSQYFIDSELDTIEGMAVEDSDEQDVGETDITGTIYLA